MSLISTDPSLQEKPPHEVSAHDPSAQSNSSEDLAMDGVSVNSASSSKESIQICFDHIKEIASNMDSALKKAGHMLSDMRKLGAGNTSLQLTNNVFVDQRSRRASAPSVLTSVVSVDKRARSLSSPT